MEIKFETLVNRLPKTIINNLIITNQNLEYHKEGNVYNHIKLVFNEVTKNFPNDIDLMIIAIFHDLGKIDKSHLKLRKNGKYTISAAGHELVAKKYLDKYLNLYDDLVINKEKIYVVCNQHMRSHLYFNNKMSKYSKRINFENQKYFKDIMNFRICDENGRIK